MSMSSVMEEKWREMREPKRSGGVMEMQRLKQLQATSNATSNLQKGIINPPESSLTRTIQ